MWYRTGTISVTNGSTAVTGSGTAWIANAGVGEAIYGPDGRLYEIAAIVSNTSITLASNYLGTTQTGQSYVIVPSQSYIRDLANQAAELINSYAETEAGIGQGIFPDGSLSAPALRFGSDLTTGLYRSASNEVTFVANGVAQFKFGTSGVTFLNGINATDLTLTGNTTLGNASADTVTVNAGTMTFVQGTANQVQYLDSNKKIVGSSNLVFDGTNLSIAGSNALRTSAIGTTVQAYDPDLTAWSGKTAPTGAVVGTTDTQTLSSKTFSDNPTFNGGTANGVAYLNGSKVLTTGSALTFDGQMLLVNATQGTLTVGNGTAGYPSVININGGTSGANCPTLFGLGAGSNEWLISSLRGITGGGAKGLADYVYGDFPRAFYINGYEQMRLTSTGLGIGTSNPDAFGKLAVFGGQAGASTSSAAFSTPGAAQGERADIALYSTFQGTADNITRRTADIIAGFNGGAWGSEYLSFNVGNNGGGNDTKAVTSEKMRIDSSGNLGLGVTPSGWANTIKAFDQNSIGSLATSTVSVILSNNAYSNGSNWIYKTTAAASQYQTYSGQHAWYTAPSGTAGNAISFTQAMTLDASGNLGIGTSSPSTKLDVNGTILSKIGTTSDAAVGVQNSYASFFLLQQSDKVNFYTGAGQPFVFTTNSTERMRIDSSGNVLIGTITAGASKLVVNSDSIQVNTAKTPASASDTGTTGQIAWDANYIYVCVATNTWKRSAIATW